MTSSERHLFPGQARWDQSKQVYKASRDVFCEKGLFSILFLACGRSEITRRCLLSTVDAVSRSSQEVEWIFLENGKDEDNYKLFQELDLERKVIIRQNNFGINEAINQMWAISRGEFCFVHENDWENRCPTFDFIGHAKDIFNENSDLGIIQLRAIFDNSENWGLGKSLYNPWSCDMSENKKNHVKIYGAVTNNSLPYLIGNGFYGFNNNPVIIRKSLYRECGPYPEAEMGADGRHGETLYQEEVLKTGCSIAQIGKEIYYHSGQITTKAI